MYRSRNLWKAFQKSWPRFNNIYIDIYDFLILEIDTCLLGDKIWLKAFRFSPEKADCESKMGFRHPTKMRLLFWTGFFVIFQIGCTKLWCKLWGGGEDVKTPLLNRCVHQDCHICSSFCCFFFWIPYLTVLGVEKPSYFNMLFWCMYILRMNTFLFANGK